jgi:hypothetical protein
MQVNFEPKINLPTVVPHQKTDLQVSEGTHRPVGLSNPSVNIININPLPKDEFVPSGNLLTSTSTSGPNLNHDYLPLYSNPAVLQNNKTEEKQYSLNDQSAATSAFKEFVRFVKTIKYDQGHFIDFYI